MQKKLINSSKLEETKVMWQLNITHDFGFSFAQRSLIETLVKSQYSLVSILICFFENCTMVTFLGNKY